MSVSLPEIQPAFAWGIFKESSRPMLIAGPCSAESEEQVYTTATQLKQQGISVFRAGIWKPRTRPHTFEGIGEKGLPWLQRVQQELGMKISTEVANGHHVETALNMGIDLLWVGARTSTNPFAVQEVADALKGTDIPVLVKNPVISDIGTWLGAIERLVLAGVTKIGAIHRGFQVYRDSKYRNMPQWQIPIELKQCCKTISLFCDPSHIGGNSVYIKEICQKSMDLGFDGLMIESHCSPEAALSDASQQVTPAKLYHILSQLIIRNSSFSGVPDSSTIEHFRGQIDALDNMLLETLAQRMQIVEEIGEYKKRHNITILQADRWEEIIRRMVQQAKIHRIDPELVKNLFESIHQASIDKQTEIMNSDEIKG